MHRYANGISDVFIIVNDCKAQIKEEKWINEQKEKRTKSYE